MKMIQYLEDDSYIDEFEDEEEYDCIPIENIDKIKIMEKIWISNFEFNEDK